jgi:hypothetical protein
MSASKLYATWHIELNVHCPACREWVDLTNCDDFWDGLKIKDQGKNPPYDDNSHNYQFEF